jgi:uncharacterized protein (TIGR03086 family)
MDLRELDRRAAEATCRIVASVSDEQLRRPTPCAEWDLAALLRHMTANNHGFADAAEGRPADPDVWVGPPLGENWQAAYQESALRVAAAFADDAVLDRTVEVLDYGKMPGSRAIGMHFIDYLVHGWDVARTIGQDPALDEESCRTVLTMGQRWPDIPQVWGGPGAPWGNRFPVADDAPVADRMLGFLGRSPNWPDQNL